MDINKDDVIRIIALQLQSMGYNQPAELLVKQASIQLEDPLITQFKAAVTQGKWPEAQALIPRLNLSTENERKLRVALGREMYLELLDVGDITNAIETLRVMVTPYATQPVIKEMSSYVLASNSAVLRARAVWPGVQGGSRLELLSTVHGCIPREKLVHPDRLLTLLKRSVGTPLDGGDSVTGLLYDAPASTYEAIPRMTSILRGHDDEVWYISFNPDGTRFASASKDKTCIIWNCTDSSNISMVSHLVGHNFPISYLDWSYNGEYLITVGGRNVCVWDTAKNKILTVFKHKDTVSAASWVPKKLQFVSAGLDSKIYLVDIHGNILRSWITGIVHDLHINPISSTLIVACQTKHLNFYNLASDKELHSQEIGWATMTSFCISSSGDHALLNMTTRSTPHVGVFPIQEITLYDLKNHCVIQKFAGMRQGRFVIRSCFAGPRESLVISGSEDSRVHVWDKRTGRLLHKLDSHTGPVSHVASTTSNPTFFVSASDDRTIRVWSLR